MQIPIKSGVLAEKLCNNLHGSEKFYDICSPKRIFRCRISSVVEHFTRNEGVPSSSLGFGSQNQANARRISLRAFVLASLPLFYSRIPVDIAFVQSLHLSCKPIANNRYMSDAKHSNHGLCRSSLLYRSGVWSGNDKVLPPASLRINSAAAVSHS